MKTVCMLCFFQCEDCPNKIIRINVQFGQSNSIGMWPQGETDGPERLSKAKRTKIRQNTGLVVDVHGVDKSGKNTFERNVLELYNKMQAK